MNHLILFEEFSNVNEGIDGCDLKADFDMLNQKMFNNEIKPVKLRWMTTKYKLGITVPDVDGNIDYIGMSDLYVVTRQRYLDTLAHEMIHVLFTQKGIHEDDPHGPKFMAKLKELNDRFGINIQQKNNAANYKISPKAKFKEFGVVVFDEGPKGFSIVVVDPKVLDDQQAVDKFVELIKNKIFVKSLTLYMYKSTYPDLYSFQMKKSLSTKSINTYNIDSVRVKEIEQDGELIKKVVIR